MSTRITIHHRDDGTARFHLYAECLDDPIEFLYLECSGVPFEAESSLELSGTGPGSLAVQIPVKWTQDLIVGFQKALVEAFVPREVRDRACKVFEDEDAARTWLIAKPIIFGGKSAVELCRDGKADHVLYELGVIEGENWA